MSENGALVKGAIVEMPVEKSYDGLTLAVRPNVALQRLDELQDFVSKVMIDGVDYGTIPGTPKPTLYQPGAQKLCEVYGFAPDFTFTSRLENWSDDIFSYDIKCTLVSRRDGSLVGCGIGSCNSREKKYAKRSGADQVNTLQKMAAKRALVHAVLGATRSSGLFTQDLDDDERPAPREPEKPTVPTEDQHKTHHELRVMLTSAKDWAQLDDCKLLIGKARAQRRLSDEHLADLIEYGKQMRNKLTPTTVEAPDGA